VAIVAVGGAIVGMLALGSAVKHPPTLFLCSVVLSSWFGGVGPGICAGLLSAIALDYYFIPPIYAFGISLEEAPDMIVFVASAVFASWLNRDQKRAKDSVRQAHDELNAKIREITAKVGKTKEPLQAEIPGQMILGEGLIQEHAEVAGEAWMTTTAEPVDPIANELRKAEELGQEPDDRAHATDKMPGVLLDGVRESLAHHQTLRPVQDSVFCRQGDYWTIQYQGQIARLKATRGLQCLAILLGHPGREFHVSELIAPIAERPVAVTGLNSGISREDGGQMRTTRFQDAGPVLDVRAKAEYASRLAELREALEDAERLNDPEWARRVQQERDCIADQLAAAVGLGGRNRKVASQTERARSAVTKRIRNSVDKIAETIPSLGRHLGVRIKTGYFCSYNPNPDRPVAWEVRS
jgi:Domain of unknown function (DUF4118)